MLIAAQSPLHRRSLHGVKTRTTHPCHRSHRPAMATLQAGHELDDAFAGLADADGLMSVAGFGSLLSERSARTTFPDLVNFRLGRVRVQTLHHQAHCTSQLRGYRRVFAHCADIFYARGIAKPDTGEVSSLSCEPCEGQELVVAVFEVSGNESFVQVLRCCAHAPVHTSMAGVYSAGA